MPDAFEPVFRVNPPPPRPSGPSAPPPFDPTADPVWGSVFTAPREMPESASGQRGYRVRGEAVWAEAKAEYLAGHSAEAVCEAFDLGLSAFRQRARREGWRRTDRAEAAPSPGALSLEPPEPGPAAPTPELADLAWRSAAQAMRRGKVYEARAWVRLWEELKVVVSEEAADARRRARVRAEQEAQAAAEAAAAGKAPGKENEGGAEVAVAAPDDRPLAKEPDARRGDAGDPPDGDGEARGAGHGAAAHGPPPAGSAPELHRLHPGDGVQSETGGEAGETPVSSPAKRGRETIEEGGGGVPQPPS